MKAWPKISVVIPAHNEEKILAIVYAQYLCRIIPQINWK